MLPTVKSLQLDNEAFHIWMLLAVLPTSLYALTLGCKQHKRWHLLAVGSMGIAFLLFGAFVAGPSLGEEGEKTFTLIGAGLLVVSHVKNYGLCQRKDVCGCAEHQAPE